MTACDPINTAAVQRRIVFGKCYLAECGREVKCGRGVRAVNGREDVKPDEKDIIMEMGGGDDKWRRHAETQESCYLALAAGLEEPATHDGGGIISGPRGNRKCQRHVTSCANFPSRSPTIRIMPTSPAAARADVASRRQSAHESGTLSFWCNLPDLVKLNLHEAEEYPGRRTLARLQKRPKIPRESCWTMPLANGLSRGTPISLDLAFQRRSILGYHVMSGDYGHLRVPARKPVTRSRWRRDSVAWVATRASENWPRHAGHYAERQVRYWLETARFLAPVFLCIGCSRQKLASHLGKQILFPTESLPNLRMWESCQTMPLVGGFSRGSHVSPALSFRFALIDFQERDVKSRPKLFNHSTKRKKGGGGGGSGMMCWCERMTWRKVPFSSTTCCTMCPGGTWTGIAIGGDELDDTIGTVTGPATTTSTRALNNCHHTRPSFSTHSALGTRGQSVMSSIWKERRTEFRKAKLNAHDPHSDVPPRAPTPAQTLDVLGEISYYVAARPRSRSEGAIRTPSASSLLRTKRLLRGMGGDNVQDTTVWLKILEVVICDTCYDGVVVPPRPHYGTVQQDGAMYQNLIPPISQHCLGIGEWSSNGVGDRAWWVQKEVCDDV
ncbi:hypothetical protein PR048_031816 [Dryococelus australis]|uniref:Uncharacterized protein n=1 Tax=Dryococelus australis TaxID=614101 RepID=A0ABQ9G7C1_9NEOP|nr:hypothetical protein PR048_031816 [Dryococelus australis]